MSIWTAVIEQFDHDTEVALFTSEEKAVTWIAERVDHDVAPDELDLSTEELAIAWWFGPREAEENGVRWGAGEMCASLLLLELNPPHG